MLYNISVWYKFIFYERRIEWLELFKGCVKGGVVNELRYINKQQIHVIRKLSTRMLRIGFSFVNILVKYIRNKENVVGFESPFFDI